MTIHEILANMSVIDKATCVNLLMKVVYSGTPLEVVTVDKAIQGYNKTNNIIIDSYLWKMYGIFYKDYLEVLGPYISVDTFRMEKALDRRILYFLELIKEKNLATVA